MQIRKLLEKTNPIQLRRLLRKNAKKNAKHYPLPNDLQDIVLSYLDPDEASEMKEIQSLLSLDCTKKATEIIMSGPMVLTLLGAFGGFGGTCSGGRGKTNIPLTLVGLTALLGGLGVSAATSTVTVPIDLTRNVGMRVRQDIKNKIDTSRAVFFLDPNKQPPRRKQEQSAPSSPLKRGPT